jgi:protein-disulfide isomerase
VIPVSERDHRQGPDTAAITLVQYGDYECPYTRRSTWVVQAIQQVLGDQLRFVYQHSLEDADLAGFAEAVGMDMQQYTRDIAERRGLARIEEDVEGGERSGVQGTPTFFINGVLYSGSWEQDALLPALQAASRTA